MEQAERLANYKRDVARFCLRRLDFDLLLLDENIVDNVSHQFFLLEPRQTGYADEGGFKRQRYARYIERSYEVADLSLGQLMGAAPLGTNFVVASPYGMAPTHTAIPINDLLVKAGIRVAPDDTAEARAYAYGPLAHIYVNVAGQAPRGIVPPRHFKHYVDRIVKALRKARDPVTGEAIFERILTRSELPRIRMGHSLTAGDVVVFARRGYVLSGEVGTRQPRPRFLGDHGYLSNMPEMRGIFMAVGPSVPKASLGVVRTVDVAPTVSALLGISAPAQSQGKNILGPHP
jgi:predicted AlkP superfamily phosphohydrolase/phosphomutase